MGSQELSAVMTRVQLYDEIGSLDAPPGSERWAIAVKVEIQCALDSRDFDVSRLQRWISLMREHEGWKTLLDANGKPFDSYEAFSVAPRPFGLGYATADIDHIIAERKTAERLAREAKPLRKPGPPKGSRNAAKLARESKPLNKAKAAKNNVADSNIISGARNRLTGSENPKYLTARIARDRPDILERMKAGEFKSVRQAAIEAGIKQVDTPEQKAVKLIKKAENRIAIARALFDACTPDQRQNIGRLWQEWIEDAPEA